jgi:nitric-oxide synthase, bacterial
MKTKEQNTLTTYSERICSVGEPGAIGSLELLKEETRAWLRIYCAENSRPEISPRCRLQIEDELEQTGTYWQSAEELEYGAKLAWRNSTRCIGRLHWQSLAVRDRRTLRSAEEIFSALIEHVRLSAGTGKVVPMITIFAPEHSDQRPVRIWNRQLIGYAGYRRSDGTILGDPMNVPLTEMLGKLGWTRDPAGPFDLLPVLIETSEGLRWFDWPEGLILEVPIRHPDYPWFEELQLKWFALPAVSGMLLQIGGVKYPAAPFSGWYVGSEVGARDLADIQRYNVLPTVAKHLGLDTRSDRSLWKDRALVELNAAVLHSFAQAGVAMVDHHTVARQFMLHEEREMKAGRITHADWSWIVPPLSGSTTPVFHKTFNNEVLNPNFYHQPPPWRSEGPRQGGCPFGFGAAMHEI